MKLKNLKDIDLREKRVLFRVAYDVPLVQLHGKWTVADDSRIKASLPSLKILLRNKCRVIILTWLGRPGGKYSEQYRIEPVARRLSELIAKPVKKLDAVAGPGVELAVSKMKGGDIVMLENVRFFPEEEAGKAEFAKKLSAFADCVVFDAFAQSHRDYPSTTGILSHLPSVAGLSMEKEIAALDALLHKPKCPFVVIMGGAKMSDKIETLQNLLGIADVILIGGAMAHNFLKAKGIKIGRSLVEDAARGQKRQRQRIYEIADSIMQKTKDTYVNLGAGLNIPKLVLPIDLRAASSLEPTATYEDISLENPLEHIHGTWMYLDIGPRTRELYGRIVAQARTVFWNGPLGYTEAPPYRDGTRDIARAIAKSKAVSILGGGDTEAAVRQLRMHKKFSFVSTGGGAALEFLAGKNLPVLQFLTKTK